MELNSAVGGSNRRVRLLLAAVAIFILAVGAIWYWQQRPVNYLIPGVPYHGYYNHFFDAFASPVTSTAMILGYYGDSRFSLKELMDEQYFRRGSGFFRYGKFDLGDLGSFLKERGYEVWFADPRKSVLGEIKKFVNPKRNVPVVVVLRSSGSPEAQASDFVLVIGIFDKNRKVVLHDFLYGNNYEVAYDDFTQRAVPSAILAAWPSEELAPQLKGPDTAYAYPPRLKAMDIVGPLLAKRAEANQQAATGDTNSANGLYEEIITDPRFQKLHPAAQVIIHQELAALMLAQGLPDAAIAVLTERAIPLSHDYDQSYDGWSIDIRSAYPSLTRAASAWPFVQLGEAYAMKGDLKRAQEELAKALQLHPGYLQEVQNALALPSFR